jgi:hypothetical protein
LEAASDNPHIISFRNDVLDGEYNYILAIIKSVSNRLYLYTKSLTVPALGGTTSIPRNAWTHVCGVYDSTYLRIYVNGVEDSSVASTGTIVPTIGGNFALGAAWPKTWLEHFDGIIDEARLSDVGRSADWIATEYNNQNSPGTFYSCKAVSRTNHWTLQRVQSSALNIATSDYCENIALAGNLAGTDEPIVCIIKNALADGRLQLSVSEKAHAVLPVQFTAHFDPANLDEEPWEIRYPQATTTTTGGA